MKKTIITTILLIPILTFATIDKDLKYGMTDSEVMELQDMLINKGYNTLKTGYFGSKTLSAIKKYQLDNEIPTTGYVGKLTRASLNFVAQATQATTSTTTVATDTKATSTATTTEVTTYTPENVATTTQQSYNILMDTPEPITLGTPFAELDKDIYNGFIPVTLDETIINRGGTIIIDGTIPEPTGTGLSGIGREFRLTSGRDLKIHLNQSRGLYTYKVTVKDSRGNIISESDGSINIPKFPQE